MNRLVLSLFLGLSAFAQSAVTNMVLNPREVILVPVAIDRLTTICFPGSKSIAHLEAAFVSTDTEPPARFQIAFKGGSCFSVRALLANATATVNVHWNHDTYVFELVSSSKPILALTLVEPLTRASRIPARSPGTHRLLGILDTAKAYSILREQHPGEVADVSLVRRNDRYDFGGYDIVLQEVLRFQDEALVFRVLLRNRAKTPLHYLPQSFRVRVGERTFYASIADGDGTVPALAEVPAYFAITTGHDGSRLGLSIQNDFLILVTVLEPPAASASVFPVRPPTRSPKHNELIR